MATIKIKHVIHARWIIPVEPYATVFEHHALLVDEQGKIIGIEPSTLVAHLTSVTHEYLTQHVLIPGLINTHCHAAMSLLRGVGSDHHLMDWLNHHIWPLERRHLSHSFVHDGSLLAFSELLCGGVTTVADMYFHPNAVIQAAHQLGIRVYVGGHDQIGSGTRYLEPLLDSCHVPDPSRITLSLSVHAPYTETDDTFLQAVSLARDCGLILQTHIHETLTEVNTPHQRPFKRLHSLGVIAPFTIAAHMVHVTPEEIAMTVEAGMSVSHNPGSNMKLASGMAPIHDMIQSGINVALGTDGAASNNKLDMFSEMRLASLLAKNREQDPTVIPAPLALQMATLNGARALGREHDLGSLTTGKWADVVAVNMHHIGTALVADPIAELVYAADRSQVDHVWVAGEKLLTHGVPEKVNQSILLAQASLWRSNLYPDLINNHHRNEKQKQ